MTQSMSEATGNLISGAQELDYAADSVVGLVREHNEDSFVAEQPLFAVCDGMGGHEAGEVASHIAATVIMSKAPTVADGELLAQAIVEANHAVIEGARRGDGRPGMGTTCTAALIDGDRMLIGHVGDSRAYKLSGGELIQLTQDHSLVAELVRLGEITPEEARVHPQRSVITRALGSEPSTVPDIYEFALREGDRILVNTDGLSGMISDDRIEAIMQEAPSARECVDALIDAALEAGGHDNITVVVVDVLSTERPEATPSAPYEQENPDSLTCELTPIPDVGIDAADDLDSPTEVIDAVTVGDAVAGDGGVGDAVEDAGFDDIGLADTDPAGVTPVVPASATGVLPADEVDAGAAVPGAISGDVAAQSQGEPAQGKRRGKAIAGFVVAVIAILALACVGVYAYSQSQAYLITKEGSNSTVQVYRGIMNDPTGVLHAWVKDAEDIGIEYLPQDTQDKLRTGVKVKYSEVDDTLMSYRNQANEAESVENSDYSQPTASTASTASATSTDSVASASGSSDASGSTDGQSAANDGEASGQSDGGSEGEGA